MRDWAIWYRKLFIAWLVLGLPSLVIGYGMSGGHLSIPPPDELSAFLPWLFVSLFILSPAILWRWRHEGRKEGF